MKKAFSVQRSAFRARDCTLYAVRCTLDSSGQLLVALQVFMSISITLATSAVAITVSSIQASSKYSIGQTALVAAESGAEDATMRVMRGVSYTTAGTTLAVGSASATYTVTGTFPGTKTITSVGTFAGSSRTIQVTLDIVDNAIAITSWREL